MSDNFWGLIKIIIPTVVPTIAVYVSSIIKKPSEEESRIGRLRKSLLSCFRFKIAIEIAKVLPEKTAGIIKDDYLADCKDKLNEYFAANSKLLIDFLSCEQLYGSCIRYLRCFKYGVIIIPIIGVVSVGILKVSFKSGGSLIYYIGVAVVLVILIVFLWILMEKTKDKYHDLCNEYEVVDENL